MHIYSGGLVEGQCWHVDQNRHEEDHRDCVKETGGESDPTIEPFLQVEEAGGHLQFVEDRQVDEPHGQEDNQAAHDKHCVLRAEHVDFGGSSN